GEALDLLTTPASEKPGLYLHGPSGFGKSKVVQWIEEQIGQPGKSSELPRVMARVDFTQIEATQDWPRLLSWLNAQLRTVSAQPEQLSADYTLDVTVGKLLPQLRAQSSGAVLLVLILETWDAVPRRPRAILEAS